jgi:hypothetical protein
MTQKTRGQHSETEWNQEDPALVITTEDINKAIDELERQGLVKRNGEFRKGQPVYVATEYLHEN